MTRFVMALLLLTCAVPGLAQTRRDYDLFTDPGARFSVEFPRSWRWTLVSPSGEALATFVQPDREAAVIVERFRMKQRLAPEDITDIFAQAEVDRIKEGQPRASELAARVVRQGAAPVIVIDYIRPGADGKSRERVRQYSIPVGQNLYRITCAARLEAFLRNEPIFVNIVETLKPAVDP